MNQPEIQPRKKSRKDVKYILITSPSLDVAKNVSGISSVTRFIINNNTSFTYKHFELGKRDAEPRNILWFLRIIKAYMQWLIVVILNRKILIHFNIALDKRSIIRDLPLVFLARILGRKMVLHIHGGEYLQSDYIPEKIKFCLKFLFSEKVPVIVLSSFEKNILSDKIKSAGIYVLPNCIELDDAKLFTRDYSGSKALQLLFLGRIINRKGIKDILSAISILKDKGINFKFCLAGTGEDEKDFINKADILIGSDFHYAGVVDGRRKTDLIKESDVFLLPSLSGEGLPMALLECMSFGLVPIVTDDGSMACVVKDRENGYIVSKSSPEEIASAVSELANNRQIFKRMSTEAREYIIENYNPQNYIDKLNKIYEKI
ncbi:MAG: glycosyltransferase family 4 protein [Bacteroidales bacterium]|jgi:glycosyltransferase involved in cell wall biosynthesis